MSETKEAAELAAETLTGDIRDILLTHVRSMEDPWSKMSERAQGDKIEAIERCVRTLVSRAVKIVATQGFDRIEVKPVKFTVKDNVKLEVTASYTVDNITLLAEHEQSNAILVFADPAQFTGARSEAKPDPDEPELPIEDIDEEDGESEDGEFAPDPSQPEDEPEAGEEEQAEGFPAIPAFLDRTGNQASA